MNRVLAALTHSSPNNLGTPSIPYRSFYLKFAFTFTRNLLIYRAISVNPVFMGER